VPLIVKPPAVVTPKEGLVLQSFPKFKQPPSAGPPTSTKRQRDADGEPEGSAFSKAGYTRLHGEHSRRSDLLIDSLPEVADATTRASATIRTDADAAASAMLSTDPDAAFGPISSFGEVPREPSDIRYGGPTHVSNPLFVNEALTRRYGSDTFSTEISMVCRVCGSRKFACVWYRGETEVRLVCDCGGVWPEKKK
jgi:hypothetical protein